MRCCFTNFNLTHDTPPADSTGSAVTGSLLLVDYICTSHDETFIVADGPSMPKSEASYLISFLIAFKSVDRYFVDVFPDHGPRIKEACGATVKPDAVSVRMLLLLCIFQLALFLLRSPSSCCLSSMRLDVQPCYCGYNFFFGTLRDLSLSRSFLARGSLAINL